MQPKDTKDSTGTSDQSILLNEPPDKAVFQQRMQAWHPILHPVWVIGAFFVLGAVFVPSGKYQSCMLFEQLIPTSFRLHDTQNIFYLEKWNELDSLCRELRIMWLFLLTLSGWKIKQTSNNVVEIVKVYDSYYGGSWEELGCEISVPNAGKTCTIEFIPKIDMEPPVLVYYEIDNFHQNHRSYMTSRDDNQVSVYNNDR